MLAISESPRFPRRFRQRLIRRRDFMHDRSVRIVGEIRPPVRQLIAALGEVNLDLVLLAVVGRIARSVGDRVVDAAVLGCFAEFILKIVQTVALASRAVATT